MSSEHPPASIPSGGGSSTSRKRKGPGGPGKGGGLEDLGLPQDYSEAVSSSPAEADGRGSHSVLAIALTQPFMRNFTRCAHERFSSRANPETRVKNMIEAHPRWYRFCWVADSILLGLALAVFIGASVASLGKVILG